jgi:hypothetical protein
MQQLPILELKFSADQIPSLADRFHFPGGDVVPIEIGKRGRTLGYLKRNDFIALCKWNGKRSSPHYERNSEEAIREATTLGLSTTLSEEARVQSLMVLHGVSWGSASVILHFSHSDPYPVLHDRALQALGCRHRPNYLTFRFWWHYVVACRRIASEHGCSMRTLDRALWQYATENPAPLAIPATGD